MYLDHNPLVFSEQTFCVCLELTTVTSSWLQKGHMFLILQMPQPASIWWTSTRVKSISYLPISSVSWCYGVYASSGPSLSLSLLFLQLSFSNAFNPDGSQHFLCRKCISHIKNELHVLGDVVLFYSLNFFQSNLLLPSPLVMPTMVSTTNTLC